MAFYDIKEVERELNRLNIPNKYRNIPIKEVLTNNYTMIVSIRENAGKTTEGLLIGAILHKTRGITIEYIRSDNDQTRRKSVENLFGTIINCKYIEKIFRGKYNSVSYMSQQKKFFLVKRDSDGAIIEKAEKPFCAVHSNEEWSSLKSTYNNPSGLFIFYDEFMDSGRATMNQWEEFMNNISTIGRPDSRRDDDGSSLVHVLMTGNNSNVYSHWFDDFCISEKVRELSFGHSFREKTQMGTTIYFKLLDPDEGIKKKVKEGRIDFFGFNTKKAAAFTGISEWSGKTFPHLEFNLNSKDVRKVYDRLFVRHRGRLIQMELYHSKENREFVFCHFASEPYKNDNIILTLNPRAKCDVYGRGEYESNKRVYELIRIYFRLRAEDRFRYASNFVGEILDDFEKNIK